MPMEKAHTYRACVHTRMCKHTSGMRHKHPCEGHASPATAPHLPLSRNTGHMGCLSDLGKRNLNPTLRRAAWECRHSILGRSMEPANPFLAFPIKLDSLNPLRRLQPIGSVLQALVHDFCLTD